MWRSSINLDLKFGAKHIQHRIIFQHVQYDKIPIVLKLRKDTAFALYMKIQSKLQEKDFRVILMWKIAEKFSFILQFDKSKGHKETGHGNF